MTSIKNDHPILGTGEVQHADATDGSIFGPRRLSIDDCERVLRESGPHALVPLLERWPLYTPPARAKSSPR